MPIINFPTDPALGQTYSFNLTTYTWDGISWSSNTNLSSNYSYYELIASSSGEQQITLPYNASTSSRLLINGIEQSRSGFTLANNVVTVSADCLVWPGDVLIVTH